MILALVAQDRVRWRCPAQSWQFVSLGGLAPAYEPSFAPFASQVTGLPGEVALVQSVITVSVLRSPPRLIWLLARAERAGEFVRGYAVRG
jgi:hypothetical protein